MIYVIDGGREGKARLNILGQAMNEYSINALLKAGIKTGLKCLDAGCGGGMMTYEMANLVGAEGYVTALDFDKDIIALNLKELEDLQIHNVNFFQTDIYALKSNEEFDLIFARYLLSHLNNVEEAFQILNKALRPGGIILVEDVQFSAHICTPFSEAFETYVRWYAEVVALRGGDAELGPKLPELFFSGGLKSIEVEIAQPVGLSGPAKQMSLLTLDKIKSALLDSKIADEIEFDKVRLELESITNDEKTLISIPRTFQVWGRKSKK
ncbi:MAG: class I SAM-dependent methyltransferase [Saprospiraceae bacterium]|nr:class I SAM-dependent methyltransferase [Saprospiraceae bacterium]